MINPDERGTVVNIERFSYQNGPGLRTTVFLKGCPLRCKWCGNPETQRYITEIMVDESKCNGCAKCEGICLNGAIKIVENKISINFNRCFNCLKCVDLCPEGAINRVGESYTAQELYDIVIRDREFYGSRGGVTFSGGEPLAQAEFILPVLMQLKNENVNVCMDTSGNVDWNVLDEIRDYVDIFLYDLKHLDSRIHKEATGVGNEQIISNLKKLCSLKNRIWLRVPIIPNYNDSDYQVRKLAEFARELDIERLYLLPYHTLGSVKYEQLGKIYPMKEFDAYSVEEISRVKAIAEQFFERVYIS